MGTYSSVMQAWCSHPPNKNEWKKWKGKKHFNTNQAGPVEPPSDPSVHHELNIMKLDPALQFPN